MNFTRLLIAVVLFLAALPRPAAAQIPAGSFQSLLVDNDCEDVPGLPADWTGGRGDLDGTWTMQKLDHHKYRLISREDYNKDPKTGGQPAFDICVAHLGGSLFFDATSQIVLPGGDELLGDDSTPLWMPIHFIGKLDIERDALHFLVLDDGWLQDALKSGRVRVTTTMEDDGDYILTAPSKELKAFVTRFAADLKVFSVDEELDRVPPKGRAQCH
ncbi:MAG TPA: hypothetical protein VGT03_08595 [Candidatus Acidoferrales bacterium]|nr:hypothetical protein [Candidatus Acidoferrales bacterium]